MWTHVKEYTWGTPWDPALVARTTQQPDNLLTGKIYTFSIPTGACFDGERYYGMELLAIETYQDFRQNTDVPQPGSLSAAGYAFHGQIYNNVALLTNTRIPKEHTTWLRVEYTQDNSNMLEEKRSEIIGSFDKKITAFAEANPNDGNLMPPNSWECQRHDCTDGAGNGTLLTGPTIFCNLQWTVNITPDDLGNAVDPLYPYTFGWIRVRTRIRFRMRQVSREDFFQNRK